MPRPDAALRALYRIHDTLSARSLSYYLDAVVLRSSPEPRAWRLIREPWQDALVASKVPLFRGLAGHAPMPEKPWSFCDLLPRGHDKSSLEARFVSWLLAYARRPIEGYIFAADRDQGALLLQAAKDELALNPWLAARVEPYRNELRGPGGTVSVVPADAGSAYGLRGNLFIADEFTNWFKPGAKDVWRAVMSGAAKVNPTVVGVLSNAGYLGSWQHDVWKDMCADPLWRTYAAPGPMASWMDEETIASLRRKLVSQAEGRRLFENSWVNAAEELDYLTALEVEACFDPLLTYRFTPAPNARRVPHVVALDYGPKRDRTCGVVGHRCPVTRRAVVDRMDVWTGPCAPSEVWDWVQEMERAFRPNRYIIDPYQMLGVIENMQAARMPVYEWEPRGGAGNARIAQSLRTAVAGKVLALYPGAGHQLVTEIAQLVVRKMGYGFRIDHLSSKHDDQAVTLGMFLVALEDL